jgi:hypothetical protein
MHLTQMDTGPFTVAVTVPVDGAKIRTLLTSDGGPSPTYKYAKIDGLAPASASERAALLFTSVRPGATSLVAGDWNHAKTIPAGEEYELPFDNMLDAYLKPVAASPCATLLIVG